MKRSLYFLLGLLLSAVSCFAQGTRKDDIAFTSVGGYAVFVPNASVRVCVDGAAGIPCNPTVPIYSNSALTNPLTNPFNADANGNYFFYALAGNYEIQVTTPTGVYTQNDVTLPNLPGQVTTTFNYVAQSFSSTPVFSFVANTMFQMTLTGNVSSSTLIGAPAPGNVAAFSLCQDATGGRTFTFPSGFLPPAGFSLNTSANQCTGILFLYNGSTWIGVGGGGGGGGGLADPGANGIVFRTSLNVTRVATLTDLTTLGAVPNSLTINSHALTGNIILGYSDFSAGVLANGTSATTQANSDTSTDVATDAFVHNFVNAQGFVTGGPYVPTTRTVNGNALTANINISASQITTGTLPCAQLPALTGDATSSSCATTVVATHLSAPLPILQGGNGTGTPALTAGSNVTITGTWPNYTIAATGGGGSSPATPLNSLQKYGTGGVFASSSVLDDGTNVSTTENFNFGGPNPYIDVTEYGARFIAFNVPPAIPGITATCSSTSCTLSSASSFINGDGVTIVGAGTTNTMSAAAVATITPSVAAFYTGTGIVVNAPGGGSTTYNYEIAWRRQGGGVTAASSPIAVTTGSASLGSQSVNLSTCTRSGQTSTCNTSSAHGLVPGAMIIVGGTNNDNSFGGWFIVNTTPTTSQFTFISGINDSIATASGGTVTWFNCNHIVFPTPPTGASQGLIYKLQSGSYTLIGLTSPVNSNLVGINGYLTFDDFGAPMTSSTVAPQTAYYIPKTAPTVATNDNLTTTIASGGTTTSITLSNAVINSVSGASILFDDAPGILAAVSKANLSAGAGMIYFPANSTLDAAYVTNSYLTFTANVSQAGPILLGDTVQYLGSWYGNLAPGAGGYFPQFATEPHVPIYAYNANPGFYINSLPTAIRGVAMVFYGNGYDGIFLGTTNWPAFIIENSTLVDQCGSCDYTGILLNAFSAANAAGIKISSTSLITGPTQVNGSSATPSVNFVNFGEITMDHVMMNRRGLGLQINPSGVEFKLSQDFETQGSIMPLVGGYICGTAAAGWIKFENTIIDTSNMPLFAHLGCTPGALGFVNVSVDGTNGPGADGLFSGWPVANGRILDTTQFVNFGQNQNVSKDVIGYIADGSIQTLAIAQAILIEEKHMEIGKSNVLFTGSPVPAAPTCSVATATPATPAGTWQFKYAAGFPPFNGWGPVSAYSSACTSNGTNQQITITIPAAITGAVGYMIWRGFDAQLTCSLITTLTYTWSSSACGGPAPTLPGAGPSGISGVNNWGFDYTVSGYMDFLSQASITNPTATNDCRLGYTGGVLVGVTSTGSSCFAGIPSGTQYGTAYYTTSTTIGSTTAPATNGQYIPEYLVTTNTAVAPSIVQLGFNSRSITGTATTDTIAFGDNMLRVVHVAAASASVNQSLPTPTTLGNSNFAYSYCNDTLLADTITPVTWTIMGQSSLIVPSGVCYTIQPDTSASTNWFAHSSSTGGLSPFVTLTDASTVSWPIPGGPNAKLTLGGNRTLSVTGLANGSKGSLFVKQPPSGGPWTLALPAGSLVENNQAGVIPWSSAANAVDKADFTFDGTNLFWTYYLNYTAASSNSFSFVHSASLNSTTCNGGTVATCSLTVASTGSGHLLVLMVSVSGSLGSAYTFSSASGGGTWVNCSACYYDLVSGSFHENNIVAYVLSSTSTATSVSITLNQNINSITMMYYEIAWSGSTISYDTGGTSFTSSCTTCTGVALSPTGGSAEVIVQFGNPGNQVTGISGGTYGNFVQDSVQFTGIGLQLNSANGAAPSWTGNTPAGNLIGSGIAFKGT